MQIFPDWTFFIQFGIFIFLMIFLSKVLFKPLLAVLDARHSMHEGANEDAKRLKEETEELKKEVYSAIAEAKVEAEKARNEALSEARKTESEILSENRKNSEKYLEQARAEIRETVDKASQDLKKEGKKIGTAIAAQLLPPDGEKGKGGKS